MACQPTIRSLVTCLCLSLIVCCGLLAGGMSTKTGNDA
eukprot:gene6423-5962_t